MDCRIFIKHHKDQNYRLNSESDISAHVSKHPILCKKKTGAQDTTTYGYTVLHRISMNSHSSVSIAVKYKRVWMGIMINE